MPNVFLNLYPGLLDEERLASAHQAEAFTRQIQRLQGNKNSEYQTLDDVMVIIRLGDKITKHYVYLWGVNVSFKILGMREVNFAHLSYTDVFLIKV